MHGHLNVKSWMIFCTKQLRTVKRPVAKIVFYNYCFLVHSTLPARHPIFFSPPLQSWSRFADHDLNQMWVRHKTGFTARTLHVTCYCTFLCHISPPWTLQRTLLEHKGSLDQRCFLCANEGVYHGNRVVCVSFTTWGLRGFFQWLCQFAPLHRRPAPSAFWVAAVSQTSYKCLYLCCKIREYIYRGHELVLIFSVTGSRGSTSSWDYEEALTSDMTGTQLVQDLGTEFFFY